MAKRRSKLFKKLSRRKKQNPSVEAVLAAAAASDVNCALPEKDNDVECLEKGHKLQRQVSVSKLVSGVAPDQNEPLLLLSGNEECIRDDTSRTSRSGSFSSSSSSSGDESCTLRFTEPDCYGQRHPIETPALIASKLHLFEKQLVSMPAHKKKCLNQARTKCPELLTDKFKLMFLRCECFNEVKAVKRYAKYWDKRVEVFGPEKAFQPLTQHEALRDDEVAMSQGFSTLSPTKDMSGRNIVYGVTTNQDIGAYTSLSMARAAWYVFHAALEDEETQKKGLVFLSDVRVVRLSLFDKDVARVSATSLAGCIPVRLSAIHGYLPPKIFFAVLPIIKMFLGEHLRKRILLHGGTMEKVRVELAKYGLVESVIPVELGGQVEICHKSWLEERRAAGL